MAAATMPMHLLVLFFFFFFCFSVHVVPIHAFEFELDWAIPNTTNAQTYNDWASKQRFQVGDTITFKYDTDSVMVVDEDDYDACSSEKPIFYANNGKSVVGLDRPGLFYFISGVAGHCKKGQKMIVKVLGQSSSPESSPPPPPSNSTTPSGAALMNPGFFSAVMLQICTVWGLWACHTMLHG